MTADVIAFARYQQVKANDRRDPPNGPPASVRASTVLSAIKQRPMIKRASERLVVGENLWRILDRIEGTQGISKATILHNAGYGQPEDSTKRLYTFAINPSWADSVRRERAEKLTQKADKYLKIVRSASSLTGLIENDLVAELFSATGYVEGVPDYPDYILELVDKLQRMTIWIVEEANLDLYWQTVERSRGAYHADRNIFTNSGYAFMSIEDLNGTFAFVSECPPVPEVPLFLYQDGGPQKAKLQAESSPGEWTEGEFVEVVMFRELRLGIGPVDGRLQPVFTIHSRIVVNDTQGREMMKASHTDGTDMEIQVVVDGAPARGRLNYGEDFSNPFCHRIPPPPQDLPKAERAFQELEGIEPWYVLYLPVTASVVSRYCSMQIRDWLPPFDRLLFASPYPSDGGFTGWPVGTLGEAMMGNLLYLTAERLDDRLLGDAMAKSDRLAEYLEAASAKRSTAEIELQTKWESQRGQS